MEKEKLYQVENSTKQTIYDLLEKYIFKKYDLRFNSIGLDFEISLKEEREWQNLNLNSLIIELSKCGIDVSMDKIGIFIKSELVKSYNPIKDYFNSLPEWDGEGHIEKLASYVPMFDDKAFQYHLKKWMARTVKCAFEDNYVNKQAFILSHKKQHSGKSTWCRFLCPPELASYFAEDISTDKDSRIQLCKNFMINLDELASLARKETNSLKAYISKSFVNERLPYERKSTRLPRYTSFVGSTNQSTFLSDESGSVRWLVFELKGQIDFKYSIDIDIKQAWSQAFHCAYRDDRFNIELTGKDIKENEIRNLKYTKLTMEQEVIGKYFEKSNSMDDFMNSSDIIMLLKPLSLNLSPTNIGKALMAFDYDRVKHPKRQLYGYLVKKLFNTSPFELE